MRTKAYGCGRSYDEAGWAKLPYAGPEARRGRLDDGVFLLELRNCPCGSTLGVTVGLSPRAEAILAADPATMTEDELDELAWVRDEISKAE